MKKTKATAKTRQELREAEIASLGKLFSKIVQGFRPPEGLTVTQWAEAHRRLSSEASAEPGPWRTSRTPYLKAPMDAFTDPKVHQIVMVAASQVGKSEFINNCIGYTIDEDPSSALFIHPTNVDAREYSKLRIAPMIRDSPALRKKVSPAKSRDSGNTILQKTYQGGILTLCGSTEAHALASKPIRRVFGDELDRWATSAGSEGDPWSLAMARQRTFYNRMAVEVSTPTIKGASAIEAAYNTGTMERYCSRCPHCGEYSDIRWKDIKFTHEEAEVRGVTTYKVTNVYYVCPKCGCISTERQMKKAPTRWIAENPEAYNQGIRSFWLNAFVSPWVSWESIILQFLTAQGDPRKLQVVYNTCFGELWEDRGDLISEESLMNRREEYEAELPDGVLVITAGVDTQDDRMEYELVGHGMDGETWGLEKGIIMGRPDKDEVWERLDQLVFDRSMHYKSGASLHNSLTFVDEGGHFTQEVRQRCRDRISMKVFAIKGMAGPDRPYTSPPKQMKITIHQVVFGYCWQYQIGVDAGKQIIADNLRRKTPGENYCHFPLREDYGAGYFKGLLSERLEYDKNRKQPWIWKKIPGHERNEALDCRNYAMAAFVVLPKDMKALQAQHDAVLQGKPIPKPAAISQQTTQEPQRATKKTSIVDKYYDEW